jgi:uncharacterized phage protein (TIGR01671 family)
MREIKFRCWFADKMWYSIPAIRFSGHGVIDRVNLNQDDNDFDQFPDTWTGDGDYVLMQFTGLKDKNGKDVYESDIIRVIDGQMVDTVADGDRGYQEVFEDVIGEIIFEDGGFAYSGHPAGTLPMFAAEEFEVIGNIYETPQS